MEPQTIHHSLSLIGIFSVFLLLSQTSIAKEKETIPEYIEIIERADCPLGFAKKNFPSLENKYLSAPILKNLNDDFIIYEKYKFYPEKRDFVFDKLCTVKECQDRDNIEKIKQDLNKKNDDILLKNRDINYKNQQILSEKDEVNRKNKTIQKEIDFLNRYNEITAPTLLIGIIRDSRPILKYFPIHWDPVAPSEFLHLQMAPPLFKEWEYYITTTPTYDTTSTFFNNESIQNKNETSEKLNHEIRKINRKIEEENKKKLSDFKSYLTHDVLTNLLKDHRERLEQYCITCDIDTPFLTDAGICKKCPNREWVATKENKLKGYCRLKQGEK